MTSASITGNRERVKYAEIEIIRNTTMISTKGRWALPSCLAIANHFEASSLISKSKMHERPLSNYGKWETLLVYPIIPVDRLLLYLFKLII